MNADEPIVPRVFIYCDDASHPRKRVAVMNWELIEPEDAAFPDGTPDPNAGAWEEYWPSTARRGGMHADTVLSDDAVWAGPPGLDFDDAPDLRRRSRIECRKCHGRTAVVVREEHLFKVLNAYARVGVSQVSLGLLAASLGRIRD